MNFEKWLDTFLTEKIIDLDDRFEVGGASGTNSFTYGVIVDAIKAAQPDEQEAVKRQIVKIDFVNGDVRQFFRHLGKCFAV